ncbi:MAG: hypothetical protein LBD80_09320 [Tannerella sp.]|nr:hypothetical protein [Tannerella sp.]
MESNIQIFKNNQFGEVRVVELNGEPMFIAVDVARALGYEKPENAIATHCKSGITLKKGGGVAYVPHTNGIGGVNMIAINEPNVYRLIMRSNLPIAEDFQEWVCGDATRYSRNLGMQVYFSKTATNRSRNT